MKINRIISQIVFVLLIAYGDAYAHADTNTQLLVAQDSAIGKSSIVLNEVDGDQPFIISSPQRSKPIIFILALAASVASLNTTSPDLIDGHGIRAPPIFFS